MAGQGTPAWRCRLLADLASMLAERFEAVGGDGLIESAITVGRESLHIWDADQEEGLGAATDHARALRLRYERLAGSPESGIDRAVELLVRSRRLHRERRSRAVAASELCLALQARYSKRQSPLDLDLAVEAIREAVELAPAEVGFRGNLGWALKNRHLSTGTRADIDDAIDAENVALRLTPPGDPDRALYQENLGLMLLIRHRLTGELDDLTQAVVLLTESVTGTWRNDPGLPRRLSERAETLLELAIWSEPADARQIGREAVQNARTAVEMTPPTYELHARFLCALAAALQQEFTITDSRQSIDFAVAAARQSVGETPAGHSERPHREYVLAVTLSQRANAGDADAAIEIMRSITAQAGGRTRGVLSLGRATALLRRYGDSADLGDVLEAIAQLTGVLESDLDGPEVRLSAAEILADAAMRTGRTGLAADALERGVDLLALVAWPGVNRMSRQRQLTRWPRIAADAAATALAVHRPDRAIERLEAGRCVMWNHILQRRTELDDLAARRPDLAARLGEISAAQDGADDPFRSSDPSLR